MIHHEQHGHLIYINTLKCNVRESNLYNRKGLQNRKIEMITMCALKTFHFPWLFIQSIFNKPTTMSKHIYKTNINLYFSLVVNDFAKHYWNH